MGQREWGLGRQVTGDHFTTENIRGRLGYIEAQIQGGVRLSDFEKISIPRTRLPSIDRVLLEKKSREFGFQIEIED